MPKPFSTPHHNMIRIPGGTFLMGSREDDPGARDNEKPQHEVKISDFEMGQNLVTQQLWQKVMGDNPSYFEGLRRPVDTVNWFDAVAFCNRLSRDTGKPFVYYMDETCRVPFALEGEVPESRVVFMQKNNPGYRLPTEAEWEYAASGGLCSGEDLTFSGGDQLCSLGWYNDNSGSESHEVGLMAPNAQGLYEMSGNLAEWCWDRYDDDILGHIFDTNIPDKGVSRVLHGGGWYGFDYRCRAVYRYPYTSTIRSHNIGFRLALSISV